MMRSAFRFAAAVSLLLFLAAAVLGVRGRWKTDQFWLTHNDGGSEMLRSSGGRLGSWLDHTNNGDVSCSGNPVQSKSGRRVARDHQQLRSLRFQIVRSLHGVTRHSFYRFRAVGKARGVTEIHIVGGRNEFK